MSFHVMHRCGDCETNPTLASLNALYDELDIVDDEHPDVAVEHESGWSLSAFPGGLLIWENVENGAPRHMSGVSKDRVLHLWHLLAAGDIDAVDAEPWQDGYG